MNRNIEIGKYFAYILANIAVVGFGLAFYQGMWWALVEAICAAKLGFWLTWRIGYGD